MGNGDEWGSIFTHSSQSWWMGMGMNNILILSILPLFMTLNHPWEIGIKGTPMIYLYFILVMRLQRDECMMNNIPSSYQFILYSSPFIRKFIPAHIWLQIILQFSRLYLKIVPWPPMGILSMGLDHCCRGKHPILWQTLERYGPFLSAGGIFREFFSAFPPPTTSIKNFNPPSLTEGEEKSL